MSLTHADRRGCERYQSASSGVKDCGQQSGSGHLLYLLTFCCYQLEDMLLPLCICVQSHTFTHNSPPPQTPAYYIRGALLTALHKET